MNKQPIFMFLLYFVAVFSFVLAGGTYSHDRLDSHQEIHSHGVMIENTDDHTLWTSEPNKTKSEHLVHCGAPLVNLTGCYDVIFPLPAHLHDDHAAHDLKRHYSQMELPPPRITESVT
jgi:hypothetical protein